MQAYFISLEFSLSKIKRLAFWEGGNILDLESLRSDMARVKTKFILLVSCVFLDGIQSLIAFEYGSVAP